MSFAVLLSIMSGILLTVGFPKPQWYFVSWFALIPLFWALRGKRGKQAFLLGFACGLTHFITALYWIRTVVYHYGGLPFALAVLILLLLCSYLALYTAVFSVIAGHFERFPALWTFGLPAVWVALELLRAHLLTGFPWCQLGYTQTPLLNLIQVADLTGVYGISWLVVLGNTTIFSLCRLNRPRAGILIFGLCFLAAYLYGGWRVARLEERIKASGAWNVAVIQGNVDQAHKWDPLFQQETLKRYKELSLGAVGQDPSPDLIVWPETAVPFFFGVDKELTRQVEEIVKELDCAVLFGSPSAEMLNGRPRLLNSAYLLDSGGKPLGRYDKQHLVPFGEYVPYQNILFFVHKLVEAAGNFVSGHDPSPLSLGNRKIGVLICYEAIFPELARNTVLRGADVLVNITNDAWFGKTSAPYQHKEMARWRAIEFRVPMIRAANTGVSTIVDITGQEHGRVPLGEKGYLVSSVHPRLAATWYARWGDFFAWASTVLTICMLAYVEFGYMLHGRDKLR